MYLSVNIYSPCSFDYLEKEHDSWVMHTIAELFRGSETCTAEPHTSQGMSL